MGGNDREGRRARDATGRAPAGRGFAELPPSHRRRPTARQVYALAAALLAARELPWPETRAEASGLIERLRAETGQAPAIARVPPYRARPRRYQRPVWTPLGLLIPVDDGGEV